MNLPCKLAVKQGIYTKSILEQGLLKTPTTANFISKLDT